MLKQIKSLDNLQAQAILSSIINGLLPNPGIKRTPEEATQDSSVTDKILEEVRRRLKISENDNSNIATAKIISLLNNELVNSILSGSTKKETKGRLGQRGELFTHDYDIVLPPKSHREYEVIGIRNNHIVNTLHYPDLYEHLGDKIADDEKSISLFAKHISPKNSDNYTVLAIASRRKATLKLLEAYKIYHSDLDVSHAENSLDILKSFVEKYGVEFLTINNNKHDFILYKVIDIDKDSRSFTVSTDIEELTAHIRVDSSEKAYLSGCGYGRIRTPGKLELALIFFIDNARYHEDLTGHGVSIAEPEDGIRVTTMAT